MAESWLVALNTVRNCCAHHSRLWNKTLGAKPMIPRDDTAWHEPHEVGNHKMFGTLTVLSYMLETIAPATSWRSRLLDLMEERLPREEWRAMGFGDPQMSFACHPLLLDIEASLAEVQLGKQVCLLVSFYCTGCLNA